MTSRGEAAKARTAGERQAILAELERSGESVRQFARQRGIPAGTISYWRQWAALVRYLEDGALEIDNNRSERALRIVAVGRKNWMFARSDAGGHRAATLYSLVATCKNIGIDPFAYLRDVLSRISTHPMRRIEELTPRGWRAQLAANPA